MPTSFLVRRTAWISLGLASVVVMLAAAGFLRAGADTPTANDPAVEQPATPAASPDVSPESMPFTTCGENCTHTAQ
jgi:hypothetical protein